MNYDFLQSYDIPRQSTSSQYTSSSYATMDGAYGTYSLEPTESSTSASYYGYGGTAAYHEGYVSYREKISSTSAVSADKTEETYRYPERYVPSAKHDTGYVSIKTAYKRKYGSASSGASAAKKEANIVEITSDGKLVMFLGRDESYPDELNALIHPLVCDICNVKMNSRVSAKDHYESRVHDKGINSWLLKNYTEKGLSPPTVKRFIKQGPSGPDAFYCELCDLKLTSLTHANQHNAGKKHRLVVEQRSKPSGAGYYNAEGKWVRTGTKMTPKQNKDGRYGIGEAFKLAEVIVKTEAAAKEKNMKPTSPSTTCSLADTTTTAEGELKTPKKTGDNIKTAVVAKNPDQDPTLFCSICKVSVTSAVQMTMHLLGSKHMKKLKASGVNPIAASTVSTGESQSLAAVPQTPAADNVLYSAIKEEIITDPTDLSMYRTPSGQYYCKPCNISMSHLQALQQHLAGKRHLKKLTEEKAVAALASKKH